MLEHKKRYLQLAFNDDISMVNNILPKIPYNERIIIEAGTPFIKRYGFAGITKISNLWAGYVVADLKTVDGAFEEVKMVKAAGASGATVMGSSPVETLDLFIKSCKELEMDSMIDMIGVDDPLRVLMKLHNRPNVVILHKGRDEEGTRGKVIQYKHVNRVKSKFDVLISAAGGVDLKEARSAIFNGANIVVANIVRKDVIWKGIYADDDVSTIAEQFLRTIE